MNILFLTTGDFNNIKEHGIYTDLLREFKEHNHKVFIVNPYEKRLGKDTELVKENGVTILHVKTGNIRGTKNIVEKGLATIMIESQYKTAIQKYFSEVTFDLVLYSTPPITLVNVIKFVKRKNNCLSYLLLKDIFPQNAVDLGMLTKKGPKSIIYKIFRHKEKKLYEISDFIGCMSQANVDYVLKHNPEIDKNKVEICPNCVDVQDNSVDEFKRIEIRKKYGIPLDKKVFIYGGNLGKPQGIPFLIECLKKVENHSNSYFLIVGGGTDYSKIENYINSSKPKNIKLMSRLPKEDYDTMVAACDIGMIFLDHRFTIPNFPSRLLAYMQAKVPILAVTDPNTDIGKVIVDGGFGWWCESNDAKKFVVVIDEILNQNIDELKVFEFNYFLTVNNFGDKIPMIMGDSIV